MGVLVSGVQLSDYLLAYVARPGGGAACLGVARSLLPAAPRSGKAGARTARAVELLRVAEDASTAPEARRAAVVDALLALSAASFWAAPASDCHRAAADYDARMLASIRARLTEPTTPDRP